MSDVLNGWPNLFVFRSPSITHFLPFLLDFIWRLATLLEWEITGKYRASQFKISKDIQTTCTGKLRIPQKVA